MNTRIRKTLILPLALLCGLAGRAQGNFEDSFTEKSLRIDFALSGNKDSQSAAIERLREEPVWGGPRKNLVDTFRYGGYYINVYDAASDSLLYARGFNTLFEEWRTTEQARTETQSWTNSVAIPYPKAPVRIELTARDRSDMRFHPLLTQTVDPASIFIDQVKRNPKTVLGLATGSTPVKMYKLLAEACKEGSVSFKDCQSFNLDEYLGLAPEHDQSYHYFMKTQLFDHIDIDQAKTHVPDGLAKDIAASCQAYEDAIKAAGGIDIQLLGIGSDGHIAFNEPGCSLACRTHSQVLTQQTINDNARLFFQGRVDEVPTQAVTMGIGSIMDARKVVLLAFGKGKQDAIAGLVEGPVTAMCPCSALQYHNDCIVICDEEAAGKLRNKDYYKYIFSQTGVSNV